MMMFKQLLLLICCAYLVQAQTAAPSLSGCHDHNGIEYCFLPDGSETPIATRSATSSSSFTSATGIVTSAVATTRPTSATVASYPASVTACHAHEGEQYCLASGTEYRVLATPSQTPLPTAYEKCHLHESVITCFIPSGTEEVQVALASESESEHESESATTSDASDTAPETAATTSERTCHFHAGVEHCVGGSSSSEPRTCTVPKRDYNIPLRIGLLFVILVTSSIGVFGPILLKRFTAISMHSLVFTVLKQFGTGVIISTAYVHLLTHAQLLWANECLGQLAYEGTATAIAMAGIFLAFLVEFVGHRIVASRASRRVAHGHHHPDNETASPRCDPLVSSSPSPSPSPQEPDEKSPSTGPSRGFAALGHSHGPVTGSGRGDDSFSVSVMEAGIIFHSVIIGVTLVVAGDSFFTTLFIVILFHQFFEGLALGTRIAALPSPSAGRKGVSTLARLVMGGVFAIITPVGMAIGIGCLGSFNGNDKATIVATGTLDALSAGILVWVGVVGMWASDWVFEGGDMVHAKWPRVCVGLGSLVAGMVVMSVLGKWA